VKALLVKQLEGGTKDAFLGFRLRRRISLSDVLSEVLSDHSNILSDCSSIVKPHRHDVITR